MQFFYWLILFIAIGIAIFAVQNSNAPPVTVKFLLWEFQTSLVYTILGSILSGILLVLLLWIPKAVRTSFQKGKQPSGTPSGGSPQKVEEGKR